MTYTLILTKPKSQDFICGLSEKEVASQTKKYEKEGYIVIAKQEKPIYKK